MTTAPKPRKSGYRGKQERTIANITKLRAAMKAYPHAGILGISAELGWAKSKTEAIWQMIRPEYKKVWVHVVDYPEFFNQKPTSSQHI